MYTANEREDIRQALIDAAKADGRITGGAVTGSTARGEEDAWSDIDLAFSVRDGTDLVEVLDDVSSLMKRDHGALHQLDVPFGAWIYRVFLLPSTLQVDVAVVPASQFGARAPSFKLLFGEASQLPQAPAPNPEHLIAWAWLYALHARSSIARDKPWQAEYMISGMRDQVLSLACVRHGLPANEARGIDRLPADVVRPFEESLVCSLDLDELRRAFAVVTRCLIGEMGLAQPDLARRIQPALEEMAALPRQASNG